MDLAEKPIRPGVLPRGSIIFQWLIVSRQHSSPEILSGDIPSTHPLYPSQLHQREYSGLNPGGLSPHLWLSFSYLFESPQNQVYKIIGHHRYVIIEINAP